MGETIIRPNPQGGAAVRVRPATDADAEILGAFGAQLMALHHDWDGSRFIAAGEKTPSMYAAYLNDQLGKPDVLVLVAEVFGSPVGYVYAGIEGPDYMALRGPAGVIHDIFVETGSRRKGAGRALLLAAVEELQRGGATQIVLSTAQVNAVGQRLFAAAGFRPTMVEMTLQLPHRRG
ncbi:GNAT family N-acetyltransferase [Sinorhizobium medicae]|uniref:GNAT family N-acetyltransferase n=1 Tax=Sinorhizobium medicae TaxID=110321 RepID=UPI000FDC24F2|nr:GNAT family N-acetyltransferase [Sinorhizobium medicae]RVO69952.1 GNAT family N-acetyltransferase [Sinorhizobium medicae]